MKYFLVHLISRFLKLRSLIFAVTFFLSLICFAGLEIPNQLSTNDLHIILKDIGPATATRILSAPYPLGGYEGLELALARHEIDISSFSNLGSKVTSSDKNLSFPTLTFGKGLFYDVDVFVTLIPFAQSSSISHFSSQARIKHWQSATSPFMVSSVWHAGYATLLNAINFQNYGYDVLGTFYFKKTALYFGVGSLFSNGRFIGGANGITASQNTETVTTTLAHRVLGLDYRINQYFVAIQTDSYDKVFYSVKLGLRF